jgi:hypothetical protein
MIEQFFLVHIKPFMKKVALKQKKNALCAQQLLYQIKWLYHTLKLMNEFIEEKKTISFFFLKFIHKTTSR